MAGKHEWTGKVGDSWAREWRRTDRSFMGLTDTLLGRASARGFDRALDVGCGAGELALALARGHSGAEVVGVDISEALIEEARARSGYLGNVFFECADASTWQIPTYKPDLVVSRHGVMFFARPVEAFTHLRETSADGSRLVFSCFRDISENSWAERVASLLPTSVVVPSDPLTPGPFALADRRQVEGILTEAGWSDIALEPVDFAYVMGTGSDPVEDALSYVLSIGPAARAAAQLEETEKAAFAARLRRFLSNNVDGSIIALKAAAWIVTARNKG